MRGWARAARALGRRGRLWVGGWVGLGVRVGLGAWVGGYLRRGVGGGGRGGGRRLVCCSCLLLACFLGDVLLCPPFSCPLNVCCAVVGGWVGGWVHGLSDWMMRWRLSGNEEKKEVL